jgi:hypothetical protein
VNQQKWLSHPAVLWAMDEAPDVPARLVSALFAVARYAGPDGRGAYPSVQAVGAIVRKNDRNTRKDLAELRQLGLLLPGDQRLVKDIRADRRPFVYDLPMPRGVSRDLSHGGSQATSRNGHGGSQEVERGVAECPSGGSQATPKEVLKTSGKRARDAARAAAPPRADPATPPPFWMAPPCPECGKPYPQEKLADPGFREDAMAGDVLCSAECEAADSGCRNCGGKLFDWFEELSDEENHLCTACRAVAAPGTP